MYSPCGLREYRYIARFLSELQDRELARLAPDWKCSIKLAWQRLGLSVMTIDAESAKVIDLNEGATACVLTRRRARDEPG